MLEAGSCAFVYLIECLASNSIAVQRTDFTHNLFVVSDIVRESNFLINFVTY